MSRIFKDGRFDSLSSDLSTIISNKNVSTGNSEPPIKGSLAYDVLSDPIGAVWYSNGQNWLPITSSINGFPITNPPFPSSLPNGGIPIFDATSQTWTVTAAGLGGVSSFSAGSTGLTPSVPTVGPITLGGTLNVVSGGTGVVTIPSGAIVYGTGATPVGALLGSTGQLLTSGGTSAPGWSGSITFDGTTITGVPTPNSSMDVANKSYVDAIATGFNVHAPVQLASTLSLSAIYFNGASGVGATLTNNGPLAPLQIDTTPVSPGERILIKNQANQIENGVYNVSVVGDGLTPWVLTRSSDFDGNPPGEVVAGDFVFVENGPTNGSTGWVLTSVGTGPGGAVIIGIDPLIFVQFSSVATYSAGIGLNLSGTTFSNTGVLSNSGGTTGLTFTPSNGNSVMNGVLSVANGGTGISSGVQTVRQLEFYNFNANGTFQTFVNFPSAYVYLTNTTNPNMSSAASTVWDPPGAISKLSYVPGNIAGPASNSDGFQSSSRIKNVRFYCIFQFSTANLRIRARLYINGVQVFTSWLNSASGTNSRAVGVFEWGNIPANQTIVVQYTDWNSASIQDQGTYAVVETDP
jgi:hypothetical protein